MHVIVFRTFLVSSQVSVLFLVSASVDIHQIEFFLFDGRAGVAARFFEAKEETGLKFALASEEPAYSSRLRPMFGLEVPQEVDRRFASICEPCSCSLSRNRNTAIDI